MAKSWLQKYATYEEEVVASAVGIIAFATGGQGGATQLLKKFNQIDTVATANDSVKLVPALIGKVQGVFNNTANDLTVYPATGEYIDGTINNGFVIAPSDYVEFRAYASGRWDSYASSLDDTYQSGITAFPTGGQDNATQTNTNRVRVDTVATSGDSIKTTDAIAGAWQMFQNRGLNTMNVFPQTGDNFLGQASNTAYAVPADTDLYIYCYDDGIWTV